MYGLKLIFLNSLKSPNCLIKTKKHPTSVRKDKNPKHTHSNNNTNMTVKVNSNDNVVFFGTNSKNVKLTIVKKNESAGNTCSVTNGFSPT